MSHPITCMKLPAALALTAIALGVAAPLHAAGFGAATAAALIAKNQAALVEIHATIAVKPELIEGPPGIAEMINQQKEQEQTVTAKGVVIHGNGLIAVPLVMLDPASMMSEGIELATPLGNLRIGLKSTISSVKIVTAEGDEYPAEVALKEATAGLALLKLTAPPAKGIAALTLTKDLPVAPPFSPAIGLARLSADFGCAPTARLLRLGTPTPPPTPLVDLATPPGEPGTAVFDPDGHFIGMTVIPSRKGSGGMANLQLFLLPLSEIQRLSAKSLP